MSASATPIGTAAPRVSYPEPGTGRQGQTGFGSGSRAQREAKHRAAVASTLRWADEAAACGDHSDAIAWLNTIEAIGDKLPKVYETRRGSWCAQLGRARATRASSPYIPDELGDINVPGEAKRGTFPKPEVERIRSCLG